MLSPWQIVPNAWLLPRGISGMALWPVVLVEARWLPAGAVQRPGFVYLPRPGGAWEVPERLVQHEAIHLRQQAELLVVPFYLVYGLEYLVRRWGQTHAQAYRALSFEREAYTHEATPGYLAGRRFWAFLKFV